MQRRDLRLASEIGPDYRQVVNLIRGKVTSGEWPVGRQIPSTPELMTLTGRSITSVRRAVQQLEADGIMEGHPGKGVFVRALPEDADRERADIEAVGQQLAELRQKVEGYDDLRARVGRLEAIVVNLASRSGLPNPLGGEHDGTERAAGRARGRR
jgi:DNA-binding FadR family transcriptional regulator